MIHAARRAAWLSLALMVVICACAADERPGVADLHARTVASLSDVRTFEARLSGGFDYRECGTGDAPGDASAGATAAAHASTTPGTCGGAKRPPDRALRRASRIAPEIRAGVAVGRTDALYAAAIIDLVLSPGDLETVDRAIARLAEVSARRPQDPAALNDLAAAHLARAVQADDARDVIRALGYAHRSLLVDSMFLPARFNLALTLEKLWLIGEAREVWDGYVVRDGSSGWSAEADRRRTRLATVLRADRTASTDLMLAGHVDPARVQVWAAEERQAAREFAGERVLAAWAETMLRLPDLSSKGREFERAEEALDLAERLGAVLARTSGDRTIEEAVAAIRAASQDTLALRALAGGHAAFARGRRLFQRSALEQAAPLLDSASARLHRAGSSFRWWPRLYRGVIRMYAGEYGAADRAFAAVLDSVQESSLGSIAGLGHWVAGLSIARQGNVEAALVHYRAAARLFETLGEHENLSSSRLLLAEAYMLMGDERAAMNQTTRSLRELRPFEGSLSLHNVLLVTGRGVHRQGDPEAAIWFHREDVRIAVRSARKETAVDALVTLARTEAALGRSTQAEHTLAAAREMLAAVPDALMRARGAAEVAHAEAELTRRSNPGAAIRSASRAIDHFRRPELPARLIAALTLRSDAFLRQGDASAAEADLEEALALTERQLAGTKDYGLRASLLESAVSAYDAMIRLRVERGDVWVALDYLERSRAAGEPVPLRASARAARLLRPTAERTVISYAVLPDRLLIWAQSRDSAAFVSTALPEREVGTLVHRFENLVRHRADSVSLRAVGGELHRLLVGPLDGLIAEDVELALIPDKALHDVPFAALWDEDRYAHLVQLHPIRIASTLQTAHAATGAAVSRIGRILLVSDPAFDASLLRDLRRLPAASLETSRIALMYPRPSILHGPAALRTALIDSLPRHEILHYAGHARFRDDRPELSHLVLAMGKDGEAGLLYADEIATLDLTGVRLVVLSACSGNARRQTRNGGLSGLAQAFLAAGSRGVVGSLWEIDDEATADLMVAFHSALADGVGPAAALRAAQLGMLEKMNGRMDVWAAFQYHGEPDGA